TTATSTAKESPARPRAAATYSRATASARVSLSATAVPTPSTWRSQPSSPRRARTRNVLIPPLQRPPHQANLEQTRRTRARNAASGTAGGQPAPSARTGRRGLGRQRQNG